MKQGTPVPGAPMRRLTINESAAIGAPKSWFIAADPDGRLRLWRRTKTNRFAQGRLIEEALPPAYAQKLRAFWARPEREAGYVRVRGDPAVQLARMAHALRSIYLLPQVPREIAELAEAGLEGRVPKWRSMDRCRASPCAPDRRLKRCRACKSSRA